MAVVSEKEVMEIIRDALELEGDLTVDGSADNLEEWDSLGHLGILVALDKLFDGKVGEIKEMASANSVQKILQILRDNSLI